MVRRGSLQHDILTVLDKRRDWSRPKDILAALNREPTASNRVGVSKALKRLWECGMIDMKTPEVYNVGKSNLYRARRRH
jgi:predicted transcriptional regulator